MQTGARALADHLALEFGEGAEHLHQHPAGGAGRVDRFGQRFEFRAGRADPFEDGQKVFERAGQAVELPDAASSNSLVHPASLSVRIWGAVSWESDLETRA